MGGRGLQGCKTTWILGSFFALALIAAAASAAIAQDSLPRTRTSTRPGQSGAATSKDPATARKKNKTRVVVEVLTEGTSAGIVSQQWRPVLEKSGFQIRVRQGLKNEKPETVEKMTGTLREVRVVGRLGRDGTITFDGQAFQLATADRMIEWLRELEVYGALGAPEGKPAWGLTQEQFDKLFTALSEFAPTEIDGRELKEGITRLELPRDYPVRYSSAAEDWLKAHYSTEKAKVLQPIGKIAKGTALALVLNDNGLGFRPLRTPEGTIELVIDPVEKVRDVWPVGWAVEGLASESLPSLFELIPVQFDEQPLRDVLQAIETRSSVPIRIDHRRIADERIDFDNIRVEFQPRNSSWSLALRQIVVPKKLDRQYRRDDKGQPFVWITALKNERLSK